MQRIELRKPYLIFVGDEARTNYAKTGRGVVDWRRECCAGQLRLTPGACDLGLNDLTVAAAVDAGVGSLVIGTALVGGSIPPAWIGTLEEAALTGIDIIAGLHTRLTAIPSLVEAAATSGARLVDVRTPPPELPVGTGTKRPGQRLLTVGTDCAVGKKYTALQLERDMRSSGLIADFRASGQTGIMIVGEGIPIDCVIADFISGAAELLSPSNDDQHWDVIEGQGSLFHPGYAAVSHGLLIGSQPDAFVVCHSANRSCIEGWPHMPIPSIGDVIARTVQIGSLTNSSIRCVGISVNTSSLPSHARDKYLDDLARCYGLPAIDPMVHGTRAIIDRL